MVNDNITYDVAILTYRPDDKLIKSLDLILKQVKLPSKIIILNTDKSAFYDNIKDTKVIDNILAGSLYNGRVNIELIHIDKKEFDHGKTRNLATRNSKSDYILFMTDDAVPYDDRLASNLIDAFLKYSDVKSKVAAAYARQVAWSDARLKEKYIREYNYPDYDIIKDISQESKLGIKNYFLSNVCAMYDRNILNMIGGFEEDIILNEDTFFAYYAINKGFKIIYKSDAVVYHSHDYTYGRQFSRNFDIGVSQITKREIFDKVPSEKEGVKLMKSILTKFLKEFRLIEAMDFIVECIFRYCGYKHGRKYERLGIDECIRYASNKDYFIKKKNNA